MSAEAKAMHERFLAVNAIRDAVIEGDLSLAKKRAAELANNEELLSVFEDWGPSTEKMKASIESVSSSADLDAASLHLAHAARACGRCHDSLGVASLAAEADPPPKEDGEIGGIMRQHNWAIGRMWNGLIAPSDAAWTLGANTLADIASKAKQTPEAQNNAEVPELVSDVETLAIEAAKSVTAPEKTQVFGQLLMTCSGCHQIMRLDPVE